MLKLFKTYYLKTHVIDLSYSLSKIMTEMTKPSLEDPEESFREVNSMKYYEALFVSKVAKKWKIDDSTFGKNELAQYKDGLRKLQEFTELYTVINNLSKSFWETRCLYLDVTRELATPNIWARRDKTTHTFEEDLEISINHYLTLLKETEKFPEWNEKIKEDIGYLIHMIYTSLCNDSNFQKIFERFDKQTFFK